jgi:hypothetical protein
MLAASIKRKKYSSTGPFTRIHEGEKFDSKCVEYFCSSLGSHLMAQHAGKKPNPLPFPNVDMILFYFILFFPAYCSDQNLSYCFILSF